MGAEGEWCDANLGVTGAPMWAAGLRGEHESNGAGGGWNEILRGSKPCWKRAINCRSRADPHRQSTNKYADCLCERVTRNRTRAISLGMSAAT
jgi:hypothetical protein